MSNTLTRVIVGIIAIPILLFIIYKGGIYFFILSLIIAGIALWEFFSMFESKGFTGFKFTSIGISLILMIFTYFNTVLPFYNILIFFLLIATLEICGQRKMNPMNVLISLFGFIYIAIPFSLMNILANNPSFNYLIYIIVLVWACDTFAYFGGKLFGKTQLSEISPKKTIEGSVIGFVCTVGVSLMFYFTMTEFTSLKDALVIGCIAGIFSQIGDLFESLLKRYCGIKDSSHIIPGHGGVLDRFDSLIFITPIIYVYVMYLNL